MRTLTMKEEKRLEIIQRVFRAELTMGKASLVLGVSERQCYRIKARVKQYGVKGVVHGNRGRPCKRKLKEKEVKRIVELAKGKDKRQYACQALAPPPSRREYECHRSLLVVRRKPGPAAAATVK